MKVKSLSRVRLLATPWTAAYQAPLSMWFSRQEYWSGVPWPSLFNHAFQYSCLGLTSSHCAYLLRSSLSPLCSVYEVPGIHPKYFWYLHSMKHLNCHSTSFLPGMRRALPDRSQRERGDQCDFTCRSVRLNQNTTLSKIVSPLTLRVGLITLGGLDQVQMKTQMN